MKKRRGGPVRQGDEGMINRKAADRYARALLDVASREPSTDLDAVERDLAAFADLFTEHPALATVLLNPAVPAKRKQAAVAELTARAEVAPVLAKLLSLIAERDRLVLLPDLVVAYRERLLDHQNVVRAEVTTAVPLGADRAEALEQRLSRVTGRTVRLAMKIDPAIIGGVVARIGSTVYDGSVTRQLQKMKERLAENAQ
jgi:F-type H+-transporting ATPase subunit delta